MNTQVSEIMAMLNTDLAVTVPLLAREYPNWKCHWEELIEHGACLTEITMGLTARCRRKAPTDMLCLNERISERPDYKLRHLAALAVARRWFGITIESRSWRVTALQSAASSDRWAALSIPDATWVQDSGVTVIEYDAGSHLISTVHDKAIRYARSKQIWLVCSMSRAITISLVLAKLGLPLEWSIEIIDWRAGFTQLKEYSDER